jgi:hypothetical protein
MDVDSHELQTPAKMAICNCFTQLLLEICSDYGIMQEWCENEAKQDDVESCFRKPVRDHGVPDVRTAPALHVVRCP